MGSNTSKTIKPVETSQKSPAYTTNAKGDTERDAVQHGWDSPTERKEGTSVEKTPLEALDVGRQKTQEAREAIEGEKLELEEQVKALEAQLAEAESHNLDLEETVQAFQERLDLVQSSSAAAGYDGCTETVKVKDQLINQLEEKNQVLRKQIVRLKTKWKNKVHALNEQIAETRQASSLKMFEFKDEIQRLAEQNAILTEQMKKGSLLGDSSNQGLLNIDTAPNEDPSSDPRTKIILQLSSKVSDQDAKINELQRKLTEKDQVLQSLGQGHSKSRSSSGRGSRSLQTRLDESGAEKDAWSPRLESERDESSMVRRKGSSSAVEGFRDMSANRTKGARDSPKFSTWAGQDKNCELSELQQIAQEMKRLQNTKKKGKHVLNSDKTEVDREWSGISRDSGIINSDFPEASIVKPGSRMSAAYSLDTTMSVLSDNDSCRSSPKKLKSRTPSGKSRSSLTSDLERDGFNLDSENDEDNTANVGSPRLNNIRKISASKPKKRTSNRDYGSNSLDELLNSEDDLDKQDRQCKKPPLYRQSKVKSDNSYDNAHWLNKTGEGSGFPTVEVS